MGTGDFVALVVSQYMPGNCICTLLIPLTLPVLLSSRIFHETTQIQRPIYSGVLGLRNNFELYYRRLRFVSNFLVFWDISGSAAIIVWVGRRPKRPANEIFLPHDVPQKMELGKGNAKLSIIRLMRRKK